MNGRKYLRLTVVEMAFLVVVIAIGLILRPELNLAEALLVIMPCLLAVVGTNAAVYLENRKGFPWPELNRSQRMLRLATSTVMAMMTATIISFACFVIAGHVIAPVSLIDMHVVAWLASITGLSNGIVAIGGLIMVNTPELEEEESPYRPFGRISYNDPEEKEEGENHGR